MYPQKEPLLWEPEDLFKHQEDETIIVTLERLDSAIKKEELPAS